MKVNTEKKNTSRERKMCEKKNTRKRAKRNAANYFFFLLSNCIFFALVLVTKKKKKGKLSETTKFSLEFFATFFWSTCSSSGIFSCFFFCTNNNKNPFWRGEWGRASQTIYCLTPFLYFFFVLRRWIFIWDAIKKIKHISKSAFYADAGSMMSGHVWSWSLFVIIFYRIVNHHKSHQKPNENYWS